MSESWKKKQKTPDAKKWKNFQDDLPVVRALVPAAAAAASIQRAILTPTVTPLKP
jgi:hypothetical protein